ncbi:MAG: glycosyltransferase family 2 protein [Clostridia bacterium]|nr:glycosyltransferase family 2 protein [Clostridia bacterium]
MISVVVPVYNMGDSLEKCVQSILQQEGAAFEVILVDDGSTDDSPAVCDRLAATDGRVHAFHTVNRGSGPARNHGLENARGEFVYFPDADDLLVPGALARMQAAVDESGADLLVFGYRVMEPDSTLRREHAYPALMKDGEAMRQDYGDHAGQKLPLGVQGAPWNKLFSTAVIRACGITYPPLRRHQDEGFIARYMCHARKVQFIPEVLYTHYANSRALEWKKFPVDYADIVHALYQTRKETILTWNPADVRTQKVIRQEYTDNLIKAIELSFSPKHDKTHRERLAWAREQVEKSGICDFEIYDDYSRYKKLLLRLLRGRHDRLALMLMRMKLLGEQLGVHSKNK